MKTIKELFSESVDNNELYKEMEKASEENRLDEFIAENEISATSDELEAIIREIKSNRHQLSDSQLEKAYGGANWGNGAGSGIKDRSSDVSFEFNVGEQVKIRNYHFLWDGDGVILNRKIVPQFGSYDIDEGYYPMYYVRADDGEECWFFQNRLSR
ncbi:MAG: hypothetical protein ACI4J1_08970 [Ruminiclostridium sp.]